MRHMVGAIIFSAMCGWGARAGGPGNQPTYRVQQVPIEHQLGIEINAVTQDPRGFMWIGTNNGLWRYDGRDYRHYTKRLGTQSEEGLSNKHVTALFVDQGGTLWVGTRYGLNRYHTEVDTFGWYLDLAEEARPANMPMILDLSEDKYGRIWLATTRGLLFLNPDTAELQRFQDPTGLVPETRFSRLLRDVHGFWAATRTGLAFLNQKGEAVRFVPFGEGHEGWVTDLRPAPDGSRLNVVVNGVFRRFVPDLGVFLPGIVPAPFKVFTVHETKGGDLWLGTDQGLVHREPDNPLIQIFEADPTNPNKMSFNQVSVLYAGREGVLWVGTKAGLNKVHDKGPRFAHMTQALPGRQGLVGSRVQAVADDGAGTVWIGTEKGVTFLVDDTFRYLTDEADTAALNGPILQLRADDRGQMWVGTPEAVVVAAASDGRPLHTLPHPRIEEMSMAFAAGAMWLTREGSAELHRYDPRSFAATTYRASDAFPYQDVYSMAVDNLGRLWLNTGSGICRYDQKADRFELVLAKKRWPVQATAVYVDPEDRTWFSTAKGLTVLDKDDTLSVVDEDAGLLSSMLFGLVPDKDGYLWLSHEKGITRFQPATRESIHYTLDDGLNNKYNWGVYHRDGAGTLYFGGGNGLTRFNPAHFRKNRSRPEVVVTALDTMQGGNSVTSTPVEDEVVQLEEGAYARFSVAVLDYTHPAKNMISYKVEGLSHDWSRPSTDPFIKLPGLEAGQYRLHIMAANNDGVWNEAGTSLELVVAPPWYLAGPALFFYALALPTLLYLLYRLRVRKLRQRERELSLLVEARTADLRREKEKTEAQARKLLELDQLKTQFFANISHEFRTPLTLIIGPLEAMLGEGDDDASKRRLRHEVMLRNARRLLRLINQLLDITKLEAGKMNLLARPGDLGAFVRPIVYAFHSLAEKQNMKLFVAVPEDGVTVYFDPEKLEKVLFNLIANAFQHTHAGGEVRVTVAAERSELGRKQAHLTVADTGEGIPAEALPHLFDRFRQVDGSTTRGREGTGIGLSLVKELVDLHGGEVWLESTLGVGTIAHVVLPLGRSHLPREATLETQLDAQEALPAKTAAIELAGLQETVYAQPTVKTTGETLLIVDDLADVRAYIRDAFPDYRVLEAVDGEHALVTARKVKPDLIISDVMMPVMDGYQLCRAVKNDPHLAGVPVVLLTAKASDDMKVEGLEHGADDYLSKPFNVRELRVRVRNLLHMRARDRDLRRSLDMAHRAQTSMLPSEVPRVPGLDIAAYCRPAGTVGGDYYDFVETADKRLGVVIGDVSGKGMPAALYMTMTKGLVAAYCTKSNSPRDLLVRINRQFRKASTPNTFISLLYAVLNPEDGTMTYASAGHNPIILVRGGKAGLLKSRGMAVGLESGKMFERVTRDEEFRFQPGDTLVLYTDGLTDALGENREVFGEARLLELARGGCHLTADGLMSRITGAYQDFVGGSEQFDDLTAVVIKIPSAA